LRADHRRDEIVRKWLSLLGLFFLARPAVAFDDAYLPLDHWAYPLLHRLQTRTGALDLSLEDLPVRRGALAKALEKLGRAARAPEANVSERDLEHLDLLERELAPELGGSAGPRYHTFGWPEEGLDVEWALRLEALPLTGARLDGFSPDSTQSTDRPGHETTVFLFVRPETVVEIADRLTWQQRFSYRFRFGDTVGAQNLDPSIGEAEFVYQNDDFVGVQRTLDTVLGIRLGSFHIEAGRLRFAWGPGREGRLLVSGDTPPVDALRVSTRFGPVQLTHAATQLRSDLGERWMAAHRIAYTAPRLTVGISETVIFGRRSYDFAYVSPVQLFYVVESNNGDADNNLFGIDVRWLPALGLEIYGELVVDDSNLRDGWMYYGNKNAFQLGAEKAGLPGLPNTDLHLEWSLVDQYTYTHRDSINVAQHFSSPVGHRIGTDADLFTVTLQHWARPWLDLRASYEQERHGEGDILKGDDQRTDRRRNFLTGTVETTRSAIAGASVRSVRGWEGRVELRYARTRNFGNERSATRVETTSAECWIKMQF